MYAISALHEWAASTSTGLRGPFTAFWDLSRDRMQNRPFVSKTVGTYIGAVEWRVGF